MRILRMFITIRKPSGIPVSICLQNYYKEEITMMRFVSNIKVELSNFGKHTGINNFKGTSRISVWDLCRAYITVGYPLSIRHLQRFPIWIWKAIGFPRLIFLLKANKYWSLKNFVGSLDSSEKRMNSYELGMLFTNLVAEKYMGIVWLRHVDQMIKKGRIKIKNGKKLKGRRGDLVGMDRRTNWHVIEAKGRTNKVKSVLDQAKNQAEQISSINGQPPVTQSGSLVLLNGKSITTLIKDPSEEEKVEIFVDKEAFLLGYYEVIFMLLETFGYHQEHIIGRKYDAFRIIVNDNKITVGVLSKIRKNPLKAPEIINELKLESIQGNESLSSGLDGVVIKWETLK